MTMPIRRSLLYFALGVLVTALFALAALNGNNQRWELAAYEHYAAVFTFNAGERHGKLTFMWLDDYYVQELDKRARLHGTPSPYPAKWENL